MSHLPVIIRPLIPTSELELVICCALEEQDCYLVYLSQLIASSMSIWISTIFDSLFLSAIVLVVNPYNDNATLIETTIAIKTSYSVI